jgi:hypothetical protein
MYSFGYCLAYAQPIAFSQCHQFGLQSYIDKRPQEDFIPGTLIRHTGVLHPYEFCASHFFIVADPGSEARLTPVRLWQTLHPTTV